MSGNDRGRQNGGGHRPSGRQHRFLYARVGRHGPQHLPPPLLRGLRRRRANHMGGVLRAFIIAAVAFVGLWILFVGGTAAAAYAGWMSITKDLPSVKQADGLPFQTTKIYDRNWKLLTEVSDPNNGYRTAVAYGEILSHIKQQQSDPNQPHTAWIFNATVAAEDSTFWTNAGVNPTAIARSSLNILSGSSFSGASTITQQLVRLIYPQKIGDSRTYSRKIREAVTAYKFTKQYSKQQILEMYLNNIYYGNRAYGIDAASQTYFNEHPWNLTLGQASMLAGLPQAPSLYDPSQNYDLAKARQHYVLDQMVKQKFITPLEADDAYAEPLNLQVDNNPHQVDLAPHFTNFVKQYLEQKFGAQVLYRDGLTVRTTLDYNLQTQAQQIVSDHVKNMVGYHVDNADLVAMLPWDGEIVSMVGSADFYNDLIDGQVNVATQVRSPGSSIKPVTYLAAFQKGWNPGTMIFDYDKKWPVPDQPGQVYEPHNDTFQYFGAISARDALDNSLNIPAVQALDFVGVQNMINLDHAMGNKSTMYSGYYGLAIGIGGGGVTALEHTNVYATMANEGRYVPYTPILSVTDGQGKSLFKLDRANALKDAQQVAPAGNAYQLTSVLTDNSARVMMFGANSPLTIPELNRPVAAKTGTSEDSRDGWTLGYTTDLTVGVWAGNTDNSPTDVDGVVSAGPIWHDFMLAAHDPKYAKTLAGPDGKPVPPDFPVPSTVYQGQVCSATGQAPIPGVATTTVWLVHGQEPKLPCNQLDPRQADDLKGALADVHDRRFTGQGIQSVYEYAATVGYNRYHNSPTRTPTPSYHGRSGP